MGLSFSLRLFLLFHCDQEDKNVGLLFFFGKIHVDLVFKGS